MTLLDPTQNHSKHVISTRHLKGKTVFNTGLDELGTVEDVMVDATSGRIVYLVLRHGGFLHIGDQRTNVPWEKLSYNTEMEGFIADIDRETPAGAPPRTSEAIAS